MRMKSQPDSRFSVALLCLLTACTHKIAPDSPLVLEAANRCDLTFFSQTVSHDSSFVQRLTAARVSDTPLHRAAAVGCVPVLDALLKAGVTPDVATQEGKTPLILAAEAGRVEAVSLLVQNHAQVDYGDNAAIQVAALHGHIPTLRTLADHGADVTVGLFSAILGEQREAVAFLLNRGAKWDHVFQPVGMNALQAAAVQGQTDIIEILLKNGANPNAGADCDKRAIYLAAMSGRAEAVEILLAAGARPGLEHVTAVAAQTGKSETGDGAVYAKIARRLLKVVEKQNLPAQARHLSEQTFINSVARNLGMKAIELPDLHPAECSGLETLKSVRKRLK
jgi:ankyrin repeat protein